MGQDEKSEGMTHSLYWEELGKMDPGNVAQRTGAAYLPERGGYSLPILNQQYLILPKERKILNRRGDIWEEEKVRTFFSLMVLLYLLNADEVEPAHAWISAQEMKGGAAFFRGPHALPVEGLQKAFGKNPEAFALSGKHLGGVELLFGDRAFALMVFPKVPLAYILWKEDDEFPAQVNILFDSTIQKHFALDGIWCMSLEVSQRLLDVQDR
jgi:hypothetical protein